MKLPESVNIHEIGPRDGFQNVKPFIALDDKMAIVEGLIAAGCDNLHLGSFVSPRAIPQMRDTAEIVRRILGQYGQRAFGALVPNLRGARDAQAAGLRRVTFVMSATESHNKANVNRTIDQSFDELARVQDELPDLAIKLDLGTIFTCPFEGVTPLDVALAHIGRAQEAGITSIALCDTMGNVHPLQAEMYLSAMLKAYPDMLFLVHMHDTEGMAMANCLVAAQLGITDFETSVAGLGGCPFAPGAAGNLATEDLVHMFEAMGVATGLDLNALVRVARLVKERVEQYPTGRLVNIAEGCCGLS